ncbi:MAG TPA: hypothetical protein VGI03_14205 [Verrucomicrobiae bacterium]|jgi:hypothetical protein
MSTTKAAGDDFTISIYPTTVTVGDIRSLLSRLKQNENSAKQPIINFIHHRLYNRYIQPLLHIPREFKSGFLIIASSCLLIETLQSFYEGLDNTKGMSNESFKAFFEREKKFFPGFAKCFPKSFTKEKNNNFYTNIRCGILHQAETTGGYSILRDKSPLFDADEKTINANKFVKALELSLDNYIVILGSSPISTAIWQNAIKKISFICNNCQS